MWYRVLLWVLSMQIMGILACMVALWFHQRPYREERRIRRALYRKEKA